MLPKILFVTLVLCTRCFTPEATSSARYYCEQLDAMEYYFVNVWTDQFANYDFSCDYAHYYDNAKISFFSSKMSEIPHKLFEMYDNIDKLSLVDCGIEQVSRRSLNEAARLTDLDLSRNKITELRNYAFEGASKLQTLNLTANNISVIEDKSFNSVRALRVLLLGGNSLKSFSAAVIVELTALEAIVLANNQLQELENRLFARNEALKIVHIQNNSLTKFAEETFCNPKECNDLNLDELVLNNNNIKELSLPNIKVTILRVKNNLLNQLHISTTVKELSCSHNKISEIVMANASESMLALLDITNNSVSSLEFIAQFRHLHTLYLGLNPVNSLNVTSFASLSQLKTLGLQETNISNLRHGIFGHQEQLEWLDLSFNSLDHVDMLMLASCAQLNTIYLDGNRLKSIDYEQMKTYFPQLKLLGIAGNDWNCTYLAKFVRYCSTQSIELHKPHTSVSPRDQPSVKGIYCLDDKHTTHNWTATIQELHSAYNESGRSDDAALTELFQSIMADVKRYGDDHSRTINQTSRLEAALFDLTKQQFLLQKDVNTIRETLLKMELSQLSNRTNDSSYSSEDLKRMIETVNNLTLDKQELSAKKLEFSIYEQSFKVDKALEMAKEIGAKLTILDKRMEQWIANIINSEGAGFYAKPLMQAQRLSDDSIKDAQGHGSNSSVMAAVLFMTGLNLTLIVGFLGYLIYRNRSRSLFTKHRRNVREGCSMTTIMDDQI
ncbi:leucine-rich repeat-containing G-protein coupled receptor 5-like [Anopheles aquasalis]|uniref:leucine-rich repeat-containing G-protein coupled receptor 5-like n=1 Tax=Anopheles aquasalis TaxID=42839 RepID=UPI00215A5589|nr:leucine-rich repeat-containing G-protein coupled receptor 5-like [Anopheles aquasalis]